MSRKLKIRDLTLRDGQQSLFATRLTQEQINRVLPYYKDAGFFAMEVWGGAVPDSVMRYLNESPWTRLKTISEAIGGASYLTALSRGRNLFGYAPYPDTVLDGFYREAVANGLGIMRIFDALNDLNNVKSSVEKINAVGAISDGAVCYTVDPHYTITFMDRVKALFGKKLPKPIFTDEYFVEKALGFEKLGAKMVTLKDMAGLVNPSRIASLMPKLKQSLKVPVDFHTHCTPGYGLASSLMAVIHGVDILDTNIWYFGGGSAAPAIELLYIFCNKLGVEMEVNMAAVSKIRAELLGIRRELVAYDLKKDSFPIAFDPLIDKLPDHIDKLFDTAIEAARQNNEAALLDACHAIEDYFGFPKPNELVKAAEVPGGMYSNMVAQLKQLKAEHVLDDAMRLIPKVRSDAGLVPLVTPTSQIVGSQAVSCALDKLKGNPEYTTVSNQFKALVKGEYGKTPVPVDPKFREKITGSPIETPYDTNSYKAPENPVLPEYGNVKLAENEQEYLLLELFPNVATTYLKGVRAAEYEAKKPAVEEVKEAAEEAAPVEPITGPTIDAPMGGKVVEIKVKVGDKVKKDDVVLVYEAMKMENDILSTLEGTVKRILVKENDVVGTNEPLIDFE